MSKFALIGPSYTSQSVNADCQSTINLYPEQIESGAGNSQIVLYPSPGTKNFVEILPPPPPPEFLDAQPLVNVPVSINTLGSFPGDSTWINVGPWPNIAINIGDLLMFFFDGSVELARPYNPILTMQLPGVVVGNLPQLGTTLDQGFTNSARRFFQVFYCFASSAVPALNSISANFTFGLPPHAGSVADSLFTAGYVQVRNVASLGNVATTIASTLTVSAGAINLTQKSFVCTFVGPAQTSMSINNPPFSIQIGNHFAAGFRINPITGTIFDLLPGNYTPTWTQSAGPFNLAVINAVFNLVPA